MMGSIRMRIKMLGKDLPCQELEPRRRPASLFGGVVQKLQERCVGNYRWREIEEVWFRREGLDCDLDRGRR